VQATVTVGLFQVLTHLDATIIDIRLIGVSNADGSNFRHRIGAGRMHVGQKLLEIPATMASTMNSVTSTQIDTPIMPVTIPATAWERPV
jgi:hypothetical protein